MIGIRAAFDTSKQHPCGITAVAGYIADTDKWQSIEERWTNALGTQRLDKFHLSDIKGRYRGDTWVEVVEPFARIIQNAGLRSVTSLLRDADWAKLSDTVADRSVCPYREHACLNLLFDALADEVRLEFEDQPITVVFDRDFGNLESVVKVHEAWCARTGHPGFSIFLKGGASWDVIPLQCADLVAGLARLDPWSHSRLDGTLDIESSPVANLARMAMADGRDVVWSIAAAEQAEDALRRLKENIRDHR